MRNQPQTDSPHRRGCLYLFIGGAAALGAVVFVAVGAVTLWLIPNARVSTMPPITPNPGAEPPPAPALLVHVDTTAPEIAALIEQAMGQQAIMITSMMPYEATLTVEPGTTGNAVAEAKLNVPRSAAAVQVMLRAYIGQPTPSGYVARRVDRPEPEIVRVVLDGPLGAAQAPEIASTTVEPPDASVSAGSLVVAVRNSDGAWGRIVQGYVDTHPEVVGEPLFDWAEIVSLDLAARFESVDEIVCEGRIRCVSADIAARLAKLIDEGIADAQGTEPSPLRYEAEVATHGPFIRATFKIGGIRETLLAYAELSRGAE